MAEYKAVGVEQMLACLNNPVFVIYDTESTGFVPNDEYSKLIQIAAVKVKDGKVIDTYNTYINPGISIPNKIAELTGITNQKVQDCPTYEEPLSGFYRFCSEGVVLVAHNARHDMKFVNHFGKRLGFAFDLPVIDTCGLAKHLIPKTEIANYKLDTLAAYFNLSNENHHDALNDCKVTYGILNGLIDICIKKEIAIGCQQVQPLPRGWFSKCRCAEVRKWEKRINNGNRHTHIKRVYISYKSELEPDLFCELYYDLGDNRFHIHKTGFPITHWNAMLNFVEKDLRCKIGAQDMKEVVAFYEDC